MASYGEQFQYLSLAELRERREPKYLSVVLTDHLDQDWMKADKIRLLCALDEDVAESVDAPALPRRDSLIVSGPERLLAHFEAMKSAFDDVCEREKMLLPAALSFFRLTTESREEMGPLWKGLQKDVLQIARSQEFYFTYLCLIKMVLIVDFGGIETAAIYGSA